MLGAGNFGSPPRLHWGQSLEIVSGTALTTRCGGSLFRLTWAKPFASLSIPFEGQPTFT